MQKDYSKMSTAELVHAAQDKDQKAFNILMLKQSKNTYSILKGLRDVIDTEEAIQEIRIRVWRYLKSVRNPAAFVSWHNTVVRNFVNDVFRKRRQNGNLHIGLVSLDEPFEDTEGSSSLLDLIADDENRQPEQILLQEEQMAIVQEALEKLPAQFRNAFIARDIEDLSYEEIAIRTKSESGTVKSRISRARAKLSALLESYKEC